jgi:hypothetical protein
VPPTAERVLPEHLREDRAADPDFDLMMTALETLPEESHQRILAKFVVTARRCEVSRDYGPLRHLTESLFATAALHADPEYRRAVEEARTTAAADERLADPADFLEYLNKRPRS